MSSKYLVIGTEASDLLLRVQEALQLSVPQTTKLKERLWTFSNRIRQPRKDDGKCNKTPFCDRWDTNIITSHLTPTDPRYATESECQQIFGKLLALMLEAEEVNDLSSTTTKLAESFLGRSFQAQTLVCVHTQQKILKSDLKLALGYSTQRLGGYEIPTSYILDLDLGGYHQIANVGWMKPLHINYQLRQALCTHLQQAEVKRAAISNALDKIQVKAYCTDKVTMPPHFSNRDVRWATWTDGNQYASHFQCAMIEMELMTQLYEFTNAPMLDPKLSDAVTKIRGQAVVSGSRLCFVTGEILCFEDYLQAAVNPKGGKSNYHVGHLLPLTRGGKHRWDNIAWVSDAGNRIQGNDTLEEIEARLIKAVEYHIRRDLTTPNLLPTLDLKGKRLWSLLNDIRSQLSKPSIPW